VSPALLQARPFTRPSATRRDVPPLLPNPRRHPYEFAHRTLPYLFLKDPDQFLTRLYEGSKPFLERLWMFVAKDMPPEEHVAPDNLDVGFQFYDDSVVAVVRLPPARAVAEALMVGCHFWTKPDPGWEPTPTAPCAPSSASGSLPGSTPTTGMVPGQPPRTSSPPSGPGFNAPERARG
jgi:hypothetical protein